MTAQLIDGKACAARLQQTIGAAIETRIHSGKRAPALATVLVGADAASQVYVRNKRQACEKLGVRSIPVELPPTVTQAELLAQIARLNADTEVDGILVQLPLPAQVDANAVIDASTPTRTWTAFTPTTSAGWRKSARACGRARPTA